MIRYILLAVVFQVLFLIIYDLFLKRETFFQWNRVYLIGTFLLSLLLPFVKIDAFSVVVPEKFSGIVLPEIVLTPENATALAETASVNWLQVLLYLGMAIASILFVFKIYRIFQLKRIGKIQRFSDFIKVIVPKSNLAFSFYRTVFLGDGVSEKEEVGILKHELVHIKQRHTLDLLFFELMRIAFWFNPLVYVYQSRISELHEFIADAHVGKNNKKEQYQLLLSQVFQTKNISFINHFYKSSLIKKRIVMLQKSNSNQILKFKYLLMLPLVAAMLFYTSCETEQDSIAELEEVVEEKSSGEVKIIKINDVGSEMNDAKREEFKNALSELFENKNRTTIIEMIGPKGKSSIKMEDGAISINKGDGEILENLRNINKSGKNSKSIGENDVPFSVIEEVPIFPGCENASDKKTCFNEKIMKHIKKNFKYPEEAQEKGVQGRVSVMFTIQEDGSIDNVRMRGPDKTLEKEAARIISKLPQMTPGKQRGRTVRVPFSVPITFKLQ